MNTAKTIIAIFIIAFTAINVNAQKITLESGSIDFVKDIDELNITYDFSDFGVGKFDHEADYIAKKKKEYNKDEEGKGDKWESEWNADKENTYQRLFEEKFSSIMMSKEIGVTVGSHPDSDYTLILKTTFLEPGYNVGISSKSASINVKVIFIKTAEPENPLAVLSMKKVPGNGFFGSDYDTATRIGDAYGKAGQNLAMYLWKKVLK